MINIEQTSAACVNVRFKDISAGWEQWIMLSSDRHFDSVKCDRSLMKKHLDLAKERNAYIIDVGDFFDAMQGRYDPRRSYAEMRPEYAKDIYLDAIVADAAKFLAPYSDRFILIGRGNHDQSIVKNNSVDIVSNLAYHLNRENGSQIKVGGYGGWIRFQFEGVKNSINLKYFHGSGGDAPVTRGVLNTARQQLYLPDADVIVNGHNHNAYHVPISRERLSNKGIVYQDIVHHVRTPSYAIDYGDGTANWHVERGGPPKPRGCVWMRMYYDGAIHRIICQFYIDAV